MYVRAYYNHPLYTAVYLLLKNNKCSMSLVTLDFSKVDWHFWFAILLSKAVLFLIVALLTLVTTQNDLSQAGLYGIYVTQSNDLALGLPLFDAIYREFHPECCQYLYLLIPVSVAFLNP